MLEIPPVTPTIGAEDAPALLFHDTTDALVPYALAQATVAAANAAGPAR